MRTADECYADMCGTAEKDFTDEERDNQELMLECAHLMFRCECCGWTCEVSEACAECAEDQGAGESCTDCCPGHDDD